jgi:hypothetical protein
MKSTYLLFEIAKTAPPLLVKLEKLLQPICDKKVKLSSSDLREYEKEISTVLKQFTGLKKVKIEFKPKLFNFMVMPLYNFDDKKNIGKKRVFFENSGSINKDKLNKYVEGMHIFCGLPFIKELKLTSGEIVAILLHEIGHIYYYHSLFPRILMHYGSVLGLSGMITGIFNTVFNGSLGVIIMSVSYLLLRTLSIFEHKEEFGCDKVATEYGFGKEIRDVMIKLGKYTGNINKDLKRSIIKKLFDGLVKIVSASSHPNSVDRVCKINRDMLEEYSKMYPEVKDEIEKQMKMLKC